MKWLQCARRCLPAAGLLPLLSLAGCVLGPDYVRPTVPSPAHYRFDPSPTRVDPQATLADVPGWWHRFGDAQLDALVDEALRANHDLGIATARVDEFAARAAAVRAEALPVLGYGAAAGRQRNPGVGTGGNYAGLLGARSLGAPAP